MTLKNDLLIDKRIVQRNIEQGKLDPVEYQKLLDALPDASDKVWRRSESSGSAAGTVAKRIPLQAPFTPRIQEPAPAGGFDQDSFSADADDDDDEDEDDDDLDTDDANEDDAGGDDESSVTDEDDDDDDDDEDDEDGDANPPD